MITKMLIEIFQAIVEDPTIKKLLGNFDVNNRSNTDLETLMDELGLNAEERVKFRAAYKDYQKDPYSSYERFKYKYEPKSNNPFDKFDAYFQKFEDQAAAHEEKYGKGTGNWSHRQYAKYRQGNQSGNTNPPPPNDEEKKHYETLEIKPGATFEQIKEAYKTAMKKYHPDRFTDATKKQYAEQISRKINAAYDYFKKKFNKS
ncbi:MAG: J domain-containing protein [Microscillaceae bacterium]|nr:J domain-containing protein [Microscillaceae bacterium]